VLAASRSNIVGDFFFVGSIARGINGNSGKSTVPKATERNSQKEQTAEEGVAPSATEARQIRYGQRAFRGHKLLLRFRERASF
jgi:hypothetical protein